MTEKTTSQSLIKVQNSGLNKNILLKEPIQTIINTSLFLALTAFMYFYCRYFAINFLKKDATAFEMTDFFVNKIEIFFLVVVNLYWFCIYYFCSPFLKQYKSNDLKWPWEEDKIKWRKTLIDAILTTLFNGMIIYPVFLYITIYFFPPLISVDEIPGFFTFLIQLLLLLTIYDFIFYWGHRFLHTPYLYSLIHKKHHSHYNTFHLSTINAHWLEFITTSIGPILLGMIIMNGKVHIITFASYSLFAFIEANETHSGYNFPFSPVKIFPFSIDSNYHNFHHLKNIGNFGGIFPIWDWLFKTNKDYYDSLAKLN